MPRPRKPASPFRYFNSSPDAVAAIASYFVPTDSPLMRFEVRGEKPLKTKAPATPFSLASKPLYVLISSNTASAAEEFTAHVGRSDLAS